ncbi:MAG: hypothetical protein NVSMB66_6330 [Candidatus Doudnabacteria bacterium]
MEVEEQIKTLQDQLENTKRLTEFGEKLEALLQEYKLKMLTEIKFMPYDITPTDQPSAAPVPSVSAPESSAATEIEPVVQEPIAESATEPATPEQATPATITPSGDVSQSDVASNTAPEAQVTA